MNSVFERLAFYGTAAERATFTPTVVGVRYIETDTPAEYVWDGVSWLSTAIAPPGAAPANALYLTLAVNGTLTQERVFTPGADLVAVDSGAGAAYTLGRSGNKILLFDSGGSAIAEYAATNAGMDLAIAAATSGDMIWLPVNVVLSGTRAVPAGVAVRGASMSKSIANCYFPSGTIVENINYNSGYNVVYGTTTGTNSPYLTTPYLVHSSSGQWGINTPPTYTGLIVANRVGVVSTGAGSSYLEGPSVMLDRAAVGNFASLIYATAGGSLWNIGIRDASSTIFWRDGGNFNTLATLTTAGAFMAISTVRSKPDAATAGIQLDHNSATGDFVLSLSPANLTANRRVTFGDVDGTNALGAGTLTSSTTNDVTVAAHTHAITASTALVAPGAAQYQVLTTGANPYPAGWSAYYLDGTAGGKTILAVTNTKTLTLTAVDNYNLTIPATGTAALLATANVFTALQTVQLATAAVKAVVIKTTDDDTTNPLLELQSSAGVRRAAFSPLGHLVIGAIAAYDALNRIKVADTIVDVSGIINALSLQINSNPAGASTATIRGATFTPNISAGNVQTHAEIDGILLSPAHNGSGTLAVMYGSKSAPTLAVGSTTTTFTHHYINKVAVGGTVGTLTGIFIDDQTLGSTNYSVRTFAGNFVINDGGDASTDFRVEGDTKTHLLFTDADVDRVGVGLSTPDRLLHAEITTASSAAVDYALRLSRDAAGLAAADGVGMEFELETATAGTMRLAAAIAALWNDATDATRKADLVAYAYDTAAREIWRGRGSGAAPMLSFYGGTPVVRGAALTAQLTTITCSAPGTPDYAIQDLAAGGFGFVSADEGQSTLKVIANLQARVAELEARLGSATGVNLFG